MAAEGGGARAEPAAEPAAEARLAELGAPPPPSGGGLPWGGSLREVVARGDIGEGDASVVWAGPPARTAFAAAAPTVVKECTVRDGFSWGLWTQAEDGAWRLERIEAMPAYLAKDLRRAGARGWVGPVLVGDDGEGGLAVAEYLCELYVQDVIARRVVRAGLCPHFIESLATCSHGGSYYAQMERGHVELDDYVRVLPVQMLRACLVQILVGLHVGQAVVGLKHHDLHASNVLVFFLRRPPKSESKFPDDALFPEDLAWRGRPLASARRFVYVLSDDEALVIPSGGFLCKIFDFNYASVRRPDADRPEARVAPAGLDLYGVERGYGGSFSPSLRGARGYDAQTLVGYLYRQHRGLARPARRHLERLLRILGGSVSKAVGRPVRVSDVPPLDVLRNAVYDEFRVRGADAVRAACEAPDAAVLCDLRELPASA